MTTTMINFRVENKQDVHMNGRRTAFRLFRKQGDAFIFDGEYTAMGWGRTDEQCIRAALKTQAIREGETA